MGEIYERFIDRIELSLQDVIDIFNIFNNKIIVSKYEKINKGGRNSNYIVFTTEKKYLLRVCSAKNIGYRNEINSYNLLKTKIKMPNLLFNFSKKDLVYLVYEYIQGEPITKINRNIIKQVAFTAALLHNIKEDSCREFDKLNYPPFSTWYNLFLYNRNVQRRLGNEIAYNLEQIISKSNDKIKEIDKIKCFTHSDYRSENMILSDGIVYFVDWEFGNIGHSLGDIGQFFRYDYEFSIDEIYLFYEIYNTYAINKLPDNWFELAKLRDLINLLQMLSFNKDMPNRYNEITKLILNTINFFNK
ncbi:MAG: aminoglycoside phosphotransferase family protein [Clostridiales bacterium]|nr:aminoglycoside phosphotransferase family protein [Clostridiales bacterium]